MTAYVALFPIFALDASSNSKPETIPAWGVFHQMFHREYAQVWCDKTFKHHHFIDIFNSYCIIYFEILHNTKKK